MNESFQIFRSKDHPGDTPQIVLYAQWLVKPLGVCALPIMVLTLVDVLQGKDILPYLLFGFPAAVILASLWTAYRMRSAAAEVVIAGPYAEVRTVLDVLSRKPRKPWRIVLDVRRSDDFIQLAVGESVFELPTSEWPEVGRLMQALVAARSAPFEEPSAPEAMSSRQEPG